MMKPVEEATISDIKSVLQLQLDEALADLRMERNHLQRCFAAQQEPDLCDVVQLVKYYRREEPYGTR